LPHDYFHDIALYRGGDFQQAVDHLEEIVKSKQIRGRTDKGAQVSQNHGPTNWESPLSLRISGNIPNVGPDTNAPPYANWYGTGSRHAPIDLGRASLEVIVNGNSRSEIEKGLIDVKTKLEGHDIKVTSIESLLAERFDNIAAHFENESVRNDFLAVTQQMEIFEKRELAEMLTQNVGSMLADHYPHLTNRERSLYLDFESAKTIENLIPKSIERAYGELAFESPEEANSFYDELSNMSYLSQLKTGFSLLNDTRSLEPTTLAA
jgi:hypothetical protein